MMKGLVSREKMSRKARLALDRQKRKVWSVNPVTRVRESAKVYHRSRYRPCRED